MQRAYINRIATSVPDHDIHKAFVAFGSGMLRDERARSLFLRMSAKSGISHRFSPLQVEGSPTPGAVDAHELYRLGSFPGTAKRMEIFERFAPQLLRATLDRLKIAESERERIRHVIVTGCTGLYAPGLDFVAMDHLQRLSCCTQGIDEGRNKRAARVRKSRVHPLTVPRDVWAFR